MTFPFPVVGFDLDGTLLDTSGELTASLNHALAQAGYPPLSVAEVQARIGGGSRALLVRAFIRHGAEAAGEALAERYHPMMIDHYRASMGQNCPAYPGLIEAMDALEERGVTLAVATNKAEALARPLLKRTGLLHRFPVVLGGDTLGPGRAKPAPDMLIEMIARCGGGRTAFVGDSIYDVTAAKRADVTSIAVRFGFSSASVETLGADHVIDHYDALVPLLASL
ncbi:HAD-IA family hydrolase [Sphingopyxis sp. MWB1]|uniref:HAD-IA family hydrolase n=1 Tax=Sphingopyxis sp. MWB1 TaxID=1537715 RepID=UPI00051A07B9|nr:HAD-IA family hydrolase [Sphingopyxis sp. MWB1]